MHRSYELRAVKGQGATARRHLDANPKDSRSVELVEYSSGSRGFPRTETGEPIHKEERVSGGLPS
jgi:hypothetical protein